MPRTSVNPNVHVTNEDKASQTEFSSALDEAQREGNREAGRTAVDVLREEGMTESGVDARREVPRTRLDSANPKMARALPSKGTVRKSLSSRRKKDLNATKTNWRSNLPGTRARVVAGVVENGENFDRLNNELRDVQGTRSSLSRPQQQVVARVDRAIQDFERTNEREHIVYSTLLAPKGTERSREALRNSLTRMVGNKETLTFDGYIASTHNLNTMDDSPEIVMEIQTRSGAYMGTSDSKPDAGHVIGRGRTLQPVDVYEAEYEKADGTTGRRWIVQMRDVSPE